MLLFVFYSIVFHSGFCSKCLKHGCSPGGLEVDRCFKCSLSWAMVAMQPCNPVLCRRGLVDRTNGSETPFTWAQRRSHVLARQEKAIQQVWNRPVPSVRDIVFPRLLLQIYTCMLNFFRTVRKKFNIHTHQCVSHGHTQLGIYPHSHYRAPYYHGQNKRKRQPLTLRS